MKQAAVDSWQLAVVTGSGCCSVQLSVRESPENVPLNSKQEQEQQPTLKETNTHKKSRGFCA